jgi:uncharacterized protein (DUF934 family)
MALIKDDIVADDPWTTLDDEEDLPVSGPVLVSLERWQLEREALLSDGRPLGVRLRSDQPPALIAGDLDHLALVALEFPKFTDGRAYSSARLLRERYGFTGELRAVGNVLRDQLVFMQRCGFDAFRVEGLADAEAWAETMTEIAVVYQRAADARQTVATLRHRRHAAE